MRSARYASTRRGWSAYAPFLPPGMSWQQLFDVIVVSAYKPEFFTTERRPVYEIVQGTGMMRERFSYETQDAESYGVGGKAFAGGNDGTLVQRHSYVPLGANLFSRFPS